MRDFLKFTLASIVGMLVVGLLTLFIFIGVITAIVSSGDQIVTVEDNSILHLDLDAQIIERATNNPFEELDIPGFEGSKKIGLNDILACIKKAKTDDRIKGIYLDPTEVSAGIATVEEIRKALIDFKESKKFIYAYGEFMSQKAYYLATAADTIVLNPQGAIDFRGLGGERNFYKKGLEKLGVEVQIVRHGKFKAAVESFTREDMSPENREQTLSYLTGIWSEMLQDISVARGITVDELNRIANQVATFRKGDFSLENKLVDELKYFDQVLDDLKELSGISLKKDLKTIEVAKYKKVPSTETKGLIRDKIAVVYASGEIDGFGDEGIKSDELSKAIRLARRDSTVKAIVLRINSPGGSAYGSDVIWREVKLASEVKPVIASMGDVAASGGYYIAAAADTIIADRTTITGSIGIFGMIPNAGELLNDKLGITQDVVTTNEHSDMPSLTRKMTPFEQDLMQSMVENGYDTFIGRVADGRQMTKPEVDEIGQGRVWASVKAKELRLVDLHGGIAEAIELAKEMAGLENYRISEYPKLKDPIDELIKQLSGSAKMSFIRSELGENYRYYEQLKSALSTKGIMARMPYDISIN
ncbi:MAG: signal peptide peptidase SppA [Bacteroidetes bacterium GWF2_42_66]|nr:MAG: signal peptide peptidase SppA [Bacteroidetes bacterium GWE2_42_39]OFY44820.1 MAG: signal peptide peptidase SppA [Bacteroidetes bacterium GWF2_42_66]HBL75946.1 signal peptide peptidase SppA [Prolixibacteraceae bacterium]HCU62062.1 signal peptide peptidase SppA [Prolixibacteraceae bacterium]